jgi:hypothetical protein
LATVTKNRQRFQKGFAAWHRAPLSERFGCRDTMFFSTCRFEKSPTCKGATRSPPSGVLTSCHVRHMFRESA